MFAYVAQHSALSFNFPMQHESEEIGDKRGGLVLTSSRMLTSCAE